MEICLDRHSNEWKYKSFDSFVRREEKLNVTSFKCEWLQGGKEEVDCACPALGGLDLQ